MGDQEVIGGADCLVFGLSIMNLCGDARRVSPIVQLRGLCCEGRQEGRIDWAKTGRYLQGATGPGENAVTPLALRDLFHEFRGQARRSPRCAGFAGQVPEMQQLELDALLLTRGGMLRDRCST